MFLKTEKNINRSIQTNQTMIRINTSQLIASLILLLVVSMIWFAPNDTHSRRPSALVHEILVSDLSDSSANDNGPMLKYYMSKYYSEFPFFPFPDANITYTSSNYSVTLFVEDSDGVSTVIAMYALNDGLFYNITMTKDSYSQGWYQGTLLGGNISGADLQYSYFVTYYANDTLGNWSNTPLCTYTFQHSMATADWNAMELYDTPDLWFVVETTGHTITWEEMPFPYPLSQYGRTESSAVLSGEFGLQYSLFQDSYLIENWGWSGDLTIDVDGLDIGDHVFELKLHGMTQKSDIVTVHVVQTPEELPPGVSTDTVGPMTEGEVGLELQGPVVVLGLSSCVIIIIVWMKRRTQPSV